MAEKSLNKKCNCCQKVHESVPSGARESEEMGWFWECDCKSTMFVPNEKMKAALKRKKVA